MIGKKGVEGLPLKYLVIALVGSLTIGIALQMTGVLRQGVMTGMGIMNQSLNEKIKQSSGLNTETVSNFGVDWHYYSDGEGVGVLRFTLTNEEEGEVNITNISATYLGATNNLTEEITIEPDETTSTREILMPSEEPGTPVQIKFVIENEQAPFSKVDSVDKGILEGEVEAE